MWTFCFSNNKFTWKISFKVVKQLVFEFGTACTVTGYLLLAIEYKVINKWVSYEKLWPLSSEVSRNQWKIIPLPWNSDETVGIVRWILDKILAWFNNILYCFLVFQWFNMLTTMFCLVFFFVFFFVLAWSCIIICSQCPDNWKATWAKNNRTEKGSYRPGKSVKILPSM